MSEKWKILGYQTNIEWYDVKTKFKQLSRKVTYSWLFQESLCWIFFLYINLVYKTGRVKFVNAQIFANIALEKRPVMLSFWHNRLMMAPFIAKAPEKVCPDHKIMTIASKHGDGKTVGKVMSKFGFISILGSTKKKGQKASRAIELGALRDILRGLKKGYSLGITPDGPRGPNQEISGELIHLAKLSGAEILPVSCSTSKFIQFDSWDKFRLPLPFSKICFYFDKETIKVAKDCDEKEMKRIKKLTKKRMDFAQEESFKLI